MGRELGEPLWPEWQSKEKLLEIKNGGMLIKDWESMYQCSPTAESGNIVERDHLKNTFKENELPPRMVKFHSWDTAGSDDEKANPTVCGTWGIYDGKYYLLNVRRGRWTFREIEKNVVKWYHEDGVNGTLIENKSAGAFIIQNLKLAGTPINIFRFNPEKHGSKRDRFEAVSPTYEAGRVLLPEKAPWKELYVEELVNYPGAISGDDQVDMSSQFLIWANRKVKKKLRMGRVGG
jgi:predicted phage terminase large subunit-like protein